MADVPLFLRNYLSMISGAVSAFVVGAVAVYTNLHALDMMTLQQKQLDEGQYQQQQSSVSLAWRTIGDANGQAFEVGQSSALGYLASKAALSGNVTLNKSVVNLDNTWAMPNAESNTSGTVTFYDLHASAFCGTEVTTSPSYVVPTKEIITPAVNLSYSFARQATFRGYAIGYDLLATDLQGARFIDLHADNTRFAAADLRNVVFHGGSFVGADFEGADLRSTKFERGAFGAGAPGGDYYDTYSIDRPVEWPSLLAANMGLNEVLAAVGRRGASPDDNYKADLSKANFTAADLQGADLRESNITQPQIDQACTDKNTKLPANVFVKGCTKPQLADQKIAALRVPLTKNPLGGKNCEPPTTH
jgi:uncharacterized protein YjbI with pentapeptide repeats